jgi:hypothetical protein
MWKSFRGTASCRLAISRKGRHRGHRPDILDAKPNALSTIACGCVTNGICEEEDVQNPPKRITSRNLGVTPYCKMRGICATGSLRMKARIMLPRNTRAKASG